MAGDLFQNFTITRALRMRLQPLILLEGVSIDRPGLYLFSGSAPLDVLRHYLQSDTRKVIYLPWDEGEKEVGKKLMGLGESLPSSDELKQAVLMWKEREGRLILFGRSWVSAEELDKYLAENPEVGLILIKGVSVFSEPGETEDKGAVLSWLRRISRNRRVGVVVCREPDIDRYSKLFDRVIEPGQAQ
ncbi:MAG: hypothetical protein M1269_01050 [Chloroflexi bacterium]|nr:hypothetical protein [Chloroflexota bacterium]